MNREEEIKITLSVLKTIRNCWADMCENEGQKISDYEAINQTIKCIEDYDDNNG